MLDGRVCVAILAPDFRFTLVGSQYEVIKLGVNELSSLLEGRFEKEIFLEKFHLEVTNFQGFPLVPVSLVGPQYEQGPDR